MRGRWLWGLALTASAAFAQPYSTNGDPRLAGLIAEALEKQPALEASLAKYRSALQRIPQATALPEPVLEFNPGPRMAETRVGPQMLMMSLSQEFPWFGKLAEKGKVAAKEAEMERQTRETLQAEIVRQVKLAYFDLAYLDRAIAITRGDHDLLGHFETLAQAQYSQGIGLQQEVLKLQAELTRDENRLDELRLRRVDAEAGLNTLLDRPPETSIPTVELRLLAADAANLDALYDRGRRNRPELKAAFLDIEKNEKRIDVARKDYWPDITLSANYIAVGQRMDPAGIMAPPPDNGKDIYNFTVGIKLPIRRRKYNAEVLEATEDFVASREGYRSALNTVEASIRSAAFRLKTLREQISLFERVLVPQANQALQSAQSAYSTGSVRVLELLDSERTLLEVSLSLAQFQSDYMKALAEMERATGSAFPEVTP
jgi:outer membrane protein, heavy metal efflux system